MDCVWFHGSTYCQWYDIGQRLSRGLSLLIYNMGMKTPSPSWVTVRSKFNRYMVFLMAPNNSKHSINDFYSIIIIIIIMQFTGFYPVLPEPQRLQREWSPHPPCIPLWWGRVTAVFNLPFQTMQLCLYLVWIPKFCRRAHFKKGIFCYQNF